MRFIPNIKIQTLIIVVLFASFGVRAQTTKSDQAAVFKTFMLEIRKHYGQERYKKEFLGVDIDQVEKHYLKVLKDNKKALPVEAFKQMLIQMAADFEDGHINIVRNSKKRWTTGIMGAVVEGNLHIVSFDPNYFNPGVTNPPLQVGDQVIAVNGVPAKRIAEENMKYAQTGTYQDRFDRAMRTVLNVNHRYFPAKQTGQPVTITVGREQPDGTIATWDVHSRWSETSEAEEAQQWKALLEKKPGEEEEDKKHADTKSKPKDEYYYGKGQNAETYFSQGVKRVYNKPGQILDVAKILNDELKEKGQKPIEEYPVYLVKHRGKSIGVLRIPQYESEQSHLDWLRKAAQYLEAHADGVVLDHLENGGGSNSMATEVLRLFANRPLAGLGHEAKISQSYIDSRKEGVLQPSLANEKAPTIADYEKARADIKGLDEKLAKGDVWTGLLSVHTNGVLEAPHEFGYIEGIHGNTISKPLLILNDKYSGSNGDEVPAILSANKRGVIWGTNSAGLGGSIYRNTPITMGIEMYMRCTFAVCINSNLIPVENIGALADVKRPTLVQDIREGFATYSLQALDGIVAQINGKSVEELQKIATPVPKVLDPAQKAVQDVIELYEKKISGEHDPLKLKTIYEELFAQIKDVPLEPEQWDGIEFPLPIELHGKDMILASLSERDEILHRLKQMKNLPRYKGEEGVHALLDTLITGIGNKEHFGFRPMKCETIFKTPEDFIRALQGKF